MSIITRRFQKTALYNSETIQNNNEKNLLIYDEEDLEKATAEDWKILFYDSILKNKLYLWVSENTSNAGSSSKQWQVFNAFLKYSLVPAINFSQVEIDQLHNIKNFKKSKSFYLDATQHSFIDAVYNNLNKNMAVQNVYWLYQNPSLKVLLAPICEYGRLPHFISHRVQWQNLFEENIDIKLIEFYAKQIKDGFPEKMPTQVADVYDFIVAVQQKACLEKEPKKDQQKFKIL